MPITCFEEKGFGSAADEFLELETRVKTDLFCALKKVEARRIKKRKKDVTFEFKKIPISCLNRRGSVVFLAIEDKSPDDDPTVWVMYVGRFGSEAYLKTLYEDIVRPRAERIFK
jgi:hypothetical protein